nr:hypothetical protein [Tanacetum cinerariifolium]
MEKRGTLLSLLALKVKNIDCDKASGVDSIGINNVESDKWNVHDHGNYGNGGTKLISFASISKEETNKKTVKASGVDSIGINNVESDKWNVHDHGNYGNGGTKLISFASISKEETNKKTVKLSVL